MILCYVLVTRMTGTYTGCPRSNVPDFGRVFLMLKYTDITQNTNVQSWTVTEIMAREVWNFDSCYTLIDYQIHIKTGKNMSFSVMLISVPNIELTCEWHKAIKLNYENTCTHIIVVLRVTSTIHEKAPRWWLTAQSVMQAQWTLHSPLKVASIVTWRISCTGCSIWNRKKPPLFSGHYLRNRSTLDIGVLGYIGIL